MAKTIGVLTTHEVVDPRKNRPGLLEAVEGRPTSIGRKMLRFMQEFDC